MRKLKNIHPGEILSKEFLSSLGYFILFTSLSVDIITPFVYHNPLYVDTLFQLFLRIHILTPENNFQN